MNASRVMSIALLVRVYGDVGGWIPLGTAFAFRNQSHFITAAHCIDGLESHQVGVLGLFSRNRFGTAQRIVRHPTSDIALLIVDPTEFDLHTLLTPFDDIDRRHWMGMNVESLGYPLDVFGPRPSFPTMRYMKGHIQRHVDHDGRRALPTPGIELSFFTDRGMSGAPVFQSMESSSVVGIVVSNVASSVPAEREEEHIDGDRYSRVVYRDVLNFGVALTLDSFEGWLNESLC